MTTNYPATTASELFADDVSDHSFQLRDVLHLKNALGAFDQTKLGEVVELPSDGLTMGANPIGHLQVFRGGSNFRLTVIEHVLASETQHLGVNSVVDTEGAELDTRSDKRRTR